MFGHREDIVSLLGGQGYTCLNPGNDCKRQSKPPPTTMIQGHASGYKSMVLYRSAFELWILQYELNIPHFCRHCSRRGEIDTGLQPLRLT